MEMNFDIVLKAAAILIEAIVAVVLVPWIKSKADEKRLDKLRVWVDLAVEAAEQIYAGSDKGVDKKAYVLEFLADKGIKADAETLDMLVEAAVFTLPKALYPAEKTADEAEAEQ